jgi:hypothetical protein
MKNRVIAFGLVLCISASFVPVAAFAGENEAKNAAIGATAASVYLLSQRRTRDTGLVGAAGSVYLWKKYHDSRSARRHREMARERRSQRQARYWRARHRAAQRYAARSRRSNSRYSRVVRAR